MYSSRRNKVVFCRDNDDRLVPQDSLIQMTCYNVYIALLQMSLLNKLCALKYCLLNRFYIWFDIAENNIRMGVKGILSTR